MSSSSLSISLPIPTNHTPGAASPNTSSHASQASPQHSTSLLTRLTALLHSNTPSPLNLTLSLPSPSKYRIINATSAPFGTLISNWMHQPGLSFNVASHLYISNVTRQVLRERQIYWDKIARHMEGIEAPWRHALYPCNVSMYKTPRKISAQMHGNVLWIAWDVARYGVCGVLGYLREALASWVPGYGTSEASSEQHASTNPSHLHILVTLSNTNHLPQLIESHHSHQTTADQQERVIRHYAAFLLKSLREELQRVKQQNSIVTSTSLLYISHEDDTQALQNLNACLEYYDTHQNNMNVPLVNIMPNNDVSIRDSDPYMGVFVPPNTDSLEKIAKLDYHLVMNHFARRDDSSGGITFEEVFGSGDADDATLDASGSSNHQLLHQHRYLNNSNTTRRPMLDFNEYLAEKYIVISKTGLTSASSTANLLAQPGGAHTAAFKHNLRRNQSSSVLLSSTSSLSSDKTSGNSSSSTLLSVPNKRALRKTYSRPVLHLQQQQQQQQDMDTPTSTVGNIQQEEAELFFSSMLSQFKKGKK